MRESPDGAETATPETGKAHGCICGAKGPALSEMLRMPVPSCNTCGHFRDGTLELLKGVREVLDQRIEELSTTPDRGAKLKVDFETPTQSSSDSRKRVVIIGANFAGLIAAMRLPPDYEVTVLDPSPWFEFLPNVHELVSGVKSPGSLRLPRERLLQRAGHRFLQQAVTAIHPAERRVEIESGASLPFDACVVAVGGVNNTLGVPGAAEYGMPFKTVDGCRRIGERLQRLLAGSDPASVVIIGGGLEGVESLGEILRNYRNRRGLTIHLVEANQRLLPGEPSVLDRQIRRACASLPVHFHTGQQVKTLAEHEVEITSGAKLASNLTIWTGGAAPPKILTEAGLTRSKADWAAVKPTLQSVFFENVFVIGDAAGLPNPAAKQAYHAMDMGACAAENVRAFLSGRALSRFRPSPEITLVSFGDLDTHLITGGHVVSGSALAAAKEAAYQFSMARIDPPLDAASFFQLQNRAWTGAASLVLPVLFSPFSLLRLANLRIAG